MTGTQTKGPQTKPAALEEFDREHRPDRLMERYAAGRVRNFASRQALTIAGSGALALFESPRLGLATLLIALFGEGLDCLVLEWIRRRQLLSRAPDRAWWISTLTATLQAVTISACVAAAWRGAGGHDGRFFAMAFLAGAAVNAGVVIGYHPGAAIGRLAVYALTPPLLFAWEIFWLGMPPSSLWLDMTGTAIQTYMVVVFLQHFSAARITGRKHRRALLIEQATLQQTSALLRQKEQEARRLAIVAEVASDSVIITDPPPHRRIIWVNPTFTQVTGFTAEEAIGKTPGELLNCDKTSAKDVEKIEEAARRGLPCRVQIQNRRKDGTRFWVEAALTPVMDEAGDLQMLVSVERDITKARSREQELIKARKAAEAGARAKAEFLATMSHEIRTPLNGIIGMADVLKQSALTPDQTEAVDAMITSGNALLTIINDILDMSKLDSGRLTLEDRPFDLTGLVRSCANILRPVATGKGITLTVEPAADDADNLIVRGDEVRLRQIVLNLLGNAVKFTNEGGVTLRWGAEGTGIFVEIEDSGVGIEPDRIDAIFDRFTQEDSATTRQFGGTGLGLSISRDLARAMGGDISVRSAKDEGSVFRLVLPLPRAPAPAAKDTVAPAPRTGGRNGDAPAIGPAGSPRPNATGAEAEQATKDGAAPNDPLPPIQPGIRILVAEDNRINRLLVKRLLEKLPVEIDFAEDGEEAVKKATEVPPDVILMDMSMPRLDGLGATRAIRRSEEISAGTSQKAVAPRTRSRARGANPGRPSPKRRQRIPIIALTANAFDDDRRKCLEAGMTGFLTKPVRREDLMRALAEATATAGKA